MHPHHTPCFVIIVHHGDPVITNRLVTSLLTNSRVPERIIVIDHGHPSPPLQVVEQDARVTLIRPPRNHGYGAGIMLGVGALLQSSQQPQQDLVLCLNNDLTIKQHTVEDLVEWWSHQSQPTIAGAKRGHVNLITGRAHLTPAPASVFAVPYLHGAAIVGSLTHIGRHLPTDYFLYSEDVALSWRALRHGIQLLALPDRIGIQHCDDDQPPSSQKTYYLVRNGAHVLERESPPVWRPYWRVGNQLRLLYHRLTGHQLIATALRDRHQL